MRDLNLYGKNHEMFNLNNRHINKLFELTEIHINWFKTFYPNSKSNNFSTLLRINHSKLSTYIKSDLMGKYDLDLIDEKFNRMFDAYHSLYEISEYNRLFDTYNNTYNRNSNKIIINNIHGQIY